MAVATSYRALDMFSPTIYYGNLISYDASHITLSDGVRSGTYYGSFTYSNVGLSGGTITGYDAYLNGVLTFTARQGNVDALTFNAYLDAGDADRAYSYAFRFADTFTGSGFADKIRGYAGSDTINGRAGNDLVNGDRGNDTLSGDTGADTLKGQAGNDSLLGNASGDSLNGGVGNDLLDGGVGNDRLNGGTGADVLVFNTALNTASNVDRIASLNVNEDIIHLDQTIFTALATGTPLPRAFYAGPGVTAGHDQTDRIVYDTSAGNLYYDADGAGGLAAIQFATLAGKPVITAADFFVIA